MEFPVRIALPFAVALAGCSPGDQQPQADASPAAMPGVADEGSLVEGPLAAGIEADGERMHGYTSLADCEIVREETAEMPYLETLCRGEAGWALRTTDSDQRQNLVVVAPSGKETSLDLTRIGGGGFSSLGPQVEWRGPAGHPFAPDALIVRYRVAEEPYPEPETSYLLAVDLAPRPCVVARVAPGPAQNAVARARADDPGACL